jgi:hypothetical protein
MGVLTVGFLLLVRLSLKQHGRLADLNPVRVAGLAHTLGYHGQGLLLAASVLVLGHGWLVLVALERFHRHGSQGALLLAFCSLSGLFWGTIFLRLLSVWAQIAQEDYERQQKLAQA